MKTYRDSVYATGIIAIATAIITLYLHYHSNLNDAAFWSNVSLAVFGGSILTLITSIIGYCNERKRILEQFSSDAHKILEVLKKYNVDWSTEKKVEFFDELAKIDLWNFGASFASICFFSTWKKKRNDVYRKIYWPLHSFCADVQKKQQKLHSYAGDALANMIKDLEGLFCRQITPFNAQLGGIACPFLYEKVISELYTWYYDMMYPWLARKEKKKENDTQNRGWFCALLVLIMILLVIFLVVSNLS